MWAQPNSELLSTKTTVSMCATKGAMNFTTILAELRTERTRIDHAINAIESLNNPDGFRRGRTATAPKRRRRQLSAAARRKLSRLMKQRWAQGKMKAK
jgi:hypothetical protein